MKKIGIVGTGITGLSLGQLLRAEHQVTLFERAEKIGGLVKCERIEDNLFHRVGGHVFNSRNQAVLDWFWSFFDRETEFVKANRNAKILFNGKLIGYPIENYLHELDKETVSAIFDDLLCINAKGEAKKPLDYPHFEAFLLGNFGQTLYNLYFKPYNTKIWNTDLEQVPLAWLYGKLPMPNLKEICMSNVVKKEEEGMVHATFYYAKENGSQFIVDRLAKDLDILTGSAVEKIEKDGKKLIVNGQVFDNVVYTGDVRSLSRAIAFENGKLHDALKAITNLPSNGTSNIFCECDRTDISWLYLPNDDIAAHRIIYTGTFAESNNRGSDRITCVVEFSGKHEYEFMKEQIKSLPGNLKALAYNYEPNSYVLQQIDTKAKVDLAKELLAEEGIYLAGRFAEWEYYNMDKAIEAAMELKQKLA